jgi:hypothetical protein
VKRPSERRRPSGGDVADRLLARLADKPAWLLTIAILGCGAFAGGIAALLGSSWHEVIAWLLAGTSTVALALVAPVFVSMRGRNLVQEARSRRDLLDLDWRQFEELVGQVFRSRGWLVERTQEEGDGGADLILHRGGDRALAQCKRWRPDIGVAEVRSFYGVMAAENIKTGFFVTTSFFTPEAERFARDVGIRLIHGNGLVREVAAVRGETTGLLLSLATDPSDGVPSRAAQ